MKKISIIRKELGLEVEDQLNSMIRILTLERDKNKKKRSEEGMMKIAEEEEEVGIEEDFKEKEEETALIEED